MDAIGMFLNHVGPGGTLEKQNPRLASRLWQARRGIVFIQATNLREVCARSWEWGKKRVFLVCPNCFHLHLRARIPVPVLFCSSCGHASDTEAVLRASVLGHGGAYYGYMYGTQERKRGVEYCLKPPEVLLVVAAAFVAKKLAGKIVGDVYDHVKVRLRGFWTRNRAKLTSRRLRGQPLETERVNSIIEREESLEIFVKHIVDYVRSARTQESRVRVTSKRRSRGVLSKPGRRTKRKRTKR